jgi:hypothetical protein
MAHVIVMVRGQRDRINDWENNINKMALPYQTEFFKSMSGDDKDRVTSYLQFGIRPIRFYDMVFPVQVTEQALQILNVGKCWTPAYNKYFNLLRWAMGLKEIPAYQQKPMTNHNFIEVAGIGYKDDKIRDGIELL